jgi:hypothetical protein
MSVSAQWSARTGLLAHTGLPAHSCPPADGCFLNGNMQHAGGHTPGASVSSASGDRNDGSRDGVRDPAAMLRAQKQCREAVEVDCLSCHFNSELPLREGVSIPNGHLHPRWVFPSVGTSIICTAACKWTAASGHRCTQVHRPGPNRCGRSEFYAEFLEILSKLFFQCFLLVGNEAPLGGRLVIGGPCRADRSGSQIAQVALSGSSIG